MEVCRHRRFYFLMKILTFDSLQVKTVVGLGSTIDIILINGRLSIGDSVLVATQEGPLVTRIRSLLIPEANEELRVTVSLLSYWNFNTHNDFSHSIRIVLNNVKQLSVLEVFESSQKIWKKRSPVFHFLSFEMLKTNNTDETNWTSLYRRCGIQFKSNKKVFTFKHQHSDL